METRQTKTTLPLVTLDGPAGVGKTTLARLLAQTLGLPYLDTGAMFRVLACNLGPDAATMPEAELAARCQKLTFSLSGCGATTGLLCNGELVGDEIRTEPIGLLASQIAQRAELRAILAKVQRRMGERQPLVAEGRDMGTVIFPDAQCKIFLDARAETRAKRRMHDPKNRDKTLDLKALTAKIEERDRLDRTRAIAPLKPADDAFVIDTSDMDLDTVLQTILSYIDTHGGRTLRSAQ